MRRDAPGELSTQDLAVFDRRLAQESRAPIAVAYSGGGDSLAALILTLAWAKPRGRPVIALCVDHRLQPQSAAWTDAAGMTARRLGARFCALAWEGEKPTAGLAAAARQARHGLIAAAAREAGAGVVVFGHTADDILETRIMREAGARLGTPQEWAPSPAWPEGRGVFLLRPLLEMRRARLRDLLTHWGEAWIDDPANDDPRSARARARRGLAECDASLEDRALETAPGAATTLAVRADCPPAGYIQISRRALREAQGQALGRFVGAACVCAGGGARTPRGRRVGALAARLAGPGRVAGALAGSRIIADERAVIFVRDAGEVARGGLAPLVVGAGRDVVWDGRFLLADGAWGALVSPLAGRAAGLSSEGRARLKAIPAPARPGLPLVDAGDGEPVCPVLAEPPAFGVESLVGERLRAACGVICKEPAT